MSYAGTTNNSETETQCPDDVTSDSAEIMMKMADELGVAVGDLEQHFAASSDVENGAGSDGESDTASMRSLGTDVETDEEGGSHVEDGEAGIGGGTISGAEESESENKSGGGDVQDASKGGVIEGGGEMNDAQGERSEREGAALRDADEKSDVFEDTGNAKMDADVDERADGGVFVDSVPVTVDGACGSSCVASAEISILRGRVECLEAAMTVVADKLDGLDATTTSREVVTAEKFESYVDSALESGHSLGVSRALIRVYLQRHYNIEPTRYTKARLNKILKKKVESKAVVLENDLFRLVDRK